MEITTFRKAEKKYNVELVDRTHLSKDDINHYLESECQVYKSPAGNKFFTVYGDEIEA